MAIIHRCNDSENKPWGYMIRCPGCKTVHFIATDRPNNCGAQWQFNGDMEKPTFNPSLLVRIPKSTGEAGWAGVCHSFIREGNIQFLGDCTHELAGKTVPIPDWEVTAP
ncbi:hypothetical protein LLG95_11890 [bacterium]|nr:hypothetical protein [bacterium]